MVDIESITTGLKQDSSGIWFSDERKNVSYPSDGHENCHKIEDISFWFKHRNNCILSVMKSYPPDQGGSVFDIGGGNGFVALAIERAGFNVVLVEPGLTGATNGKNRGLKNVICATADAARFKPHSLPAIGLFDVLEHIEDDLSFLKSLKRLLKKLGRIYITVPAYSFLWSREDVAAGHYRRYTRKSICKVIEQAGFEVEFSSYIFRFLPIPIAVFHVLPYRIGISRPNNRTPNVGRDHAVQGGAIASMLAFVLNSEIENLKNNKAMSFGGSCLIVAKSP